MLEREMTSELSRNLIDKMVWEIERLLAGPLPDEPFLLDVLSAITECRNGGYVVQQHRVEYFRRLGFAAIRYFDSFDATPEAGRTIELAGALSQAVSGP